MTAVRTACYHCGETCNNNAIAPDSISFYSYAHVLWIKGVGQRRFSEADLPADEEKRALYELGKQLFTANGYTEIGMDHLTLSGNALHDAFTQRSLHRNFMGYTVARTSLLTGLGASSISDCWDAMRRMKNMWLLINKW